MFLGVKVKVEVEEVERNTGKIIENEGFIDPSRARYSRQNGLRNPQSPTYFLLSANHLSPMRAVGNCVIDTG